MLWILTSWFCSLPLKRDIWQKWELYARYAKKLKFAYLRFVDHGDWMKNEIELEIEMVCAEERWTTILCQGACKCFEPISWKNQYVIRQSYNTQAQNPIKSIDLKEVSEISDAPPSEVSQREHVFKYVWANIYHSIKQWLCLVYGVTCFATFSNSLLI